MLIPSLLASLTAAVATYLATPLIVRWARSRDLYCVPDARRIHDRPVPRLGGIAIVAGTATGLGVSVLLAPDVLSPGGLGGPTGFALAGLLAGAGIAFSVGLVDDVRGIRPLPKLLAQIAAALVVYQLGFRIETLSWGDAAVALGWLSLPVSLLWVVGVTNAYNLVDGIDGLATGMGIVAFAATVAAAATLGHPIVLAVAAVLMGALVGFLPHNFNPARIFLGDSGSLFVGFVLAVLSVQGSMKSATAVLVAVPLFALAIPLLDTAATVARRWLRGRPISQADARHIHHRLLALGLSHRGAVLLLYVVAAAFAALGILLGFAPPRQVAVIAVLGGVVSVTLLVLGMRRLHYDEFILAGKVLASGPLRVRRVIQDRILAGDLAEVLLAATSLEQIGAVLADGAADFGLVHMELVEQREESTRRTANAGRHDPTWTLDFPVGETGRDLVLRIHARVGDEFRPYGAERIANVLGPALARRIEQGGIGPMEWPSMPDHPVRAPSRATPRPSSVA